MKPFFFPHPSALVAALCLGLCALHAAAVDERKVDIVRNGVQTTLVLPEYKSQGVPYASLTDIARQLGGNVDVADARVVFRLGDDQIAIGLEDDQLQVGGTSVTLRNPVRGYNGDALISIADLVPVLRQGFGFGTPDSPPVTSALSIDSETPALESVEPLPEPMEDTALESIDLAAQTPLESVGDPALPAETRPLADPIFADPSQFLLAIDPGHGGEDTGVVGENGLLEKELCLAVAETLRRELKEKYGIATVTTREADESRNLADRQTVFSRNRADLVLSIHAGANYAAGARGPMLYAHRTRLSLSADPKPGLKAAQSIANAFEALGDPELPLVHEVPLSILRESDVPGVLVELGNLDNPEDETRLAAAAYQEKLAAALADGINRLLGGAP